MQVVCHCGGGAGACLPGRSAGRREQLLQMFGEHRRLHCRTCDVFAVRFRQIIGPRPLPLHRPPLFLPPPLRRICESCHRRRPRPTLVLTQLRRRRRPPRTRLRLLRGYT